MSVEISRITITATIEDDTDITTDVDIEGDMPLAFNLGLLRLAEDTLLEPDDD